MISTIKSRGLKVASFESLPIKPEYTEIDRNRNWASKKAEDMNEEDDCAFGKQIKKKRTKDRGIYALARLRSCSVSVAARAANL